MTSKKNKFIGAFAYFTSSSPGELKITFLYCKKYYEISPNSEGGNFTISHLVALVSSK